MKYKDEVICRGSYAFGTACGTCSKCKDEKKAMEAKIKEIVEVESPPEINIDKISRITDREREIAIAFCSYLAKWSTVENMIYKSTEEFNCFLKGEGKRFV